jgi:hypothetical protein
MRRETQHPVGSRMAGLRLAWTEGVGTRTSSMVLRSPYPLASLASSAMRGAERLHTFSQMH